MAQFLTLARRETVMPPTRIQVGLLDPISQRLVRDAKIATEAADRLGSGSNQLNRFRAKLGRLGRSGSRHVGLLSRGSPAPIFRCPLKRVCVQ
jgi:hypothetical protein